MAKFNCVFLFYFILFYLFIEDEETFTLDQFLNTIRMSGHPLISQRFIP